METRDDRLERQSLIDEIRSLGKNYHFWKYTTAQLYHIRDSVRQMIYREEQECMQIARAYYKQKEMGIPNYIEVGNTMYVYNEGTEHYDVLEKGYNDFTQEDEDNLLGRKKEKQLVLTYTNNFMRRFTKVI